MIVRKIQRTIMVVEMTEEQSQQLTLALSKLNEAPDQGECTFTTEHREVLNDLRLSLLNS